MNNSTNNMPSSSPVIFNPYRKKSGDSKHARSANRPSVGATQLVPPATTHQSDFSQESSSITNSEIKISSDSEDEDDYEFLDDDEKEKLTQCYTQPEIQFTDDEDEDVTEISDDELPPNTNKRQKTDTPDKRRVSRQSTLSQFYEKSDTPLQSKTKRTPPSNASFGNDNKMWSYNGKQFMNFDTWKSNHEKLRVYLFCLARRDPKLPSRAIVSSVHLHLKDTILKSQTSALIQHRKKMGCKFPEMIRYATKGCILEKGRIPLKDLKTREMGYSTHGVIETDLCYENVERADKALDIAFKYQAVAGIPPQRIRLLRKPRVFEFFAGCRGLGLGFDMEGFETLHALDKSRSACDTIRANSPNIMVWNEDSERFLHKCKSGKSKRYPMPGCVEHLNLTPPCQGMSQASVSEGCNDAANNNLTKQCVDIIDYYRPHTFVMEQVVGILLESKGRADILRELLEALVIMGYQVRINKVRASSFGDPQNRDRVIIFGAKKGFVLPSIPVTTHGDGPLLAKTVTVADAIGMLESVEPNPTSGLVELPDGTLVKDHCCDTRTYFNQKSTCQLVADCPAPTVRNSNAMMHYNKLLQRQLTLRERALLQSFPIHYVFCGEHESVTRQIGNAVPVNLARAVARSVLESYDVVVS